MQVTRDNRRYGYTESLTYAAPVLTSSIPDGSDAISGIQSLSRSLVNSAGQTVESDAYVSLSGVTYSATAAQLGSAGTNYYATTYAYDDRGRRNRVQTPTADVTRTVYDAMGRPTSTWVGTDDTPSTGYWSPTNTAGTDLVKVSENEYDGGGVGDGT